MRYISCFVGFLVLTSLSCAVTLYVPGDYDTIGDAIIAASTGDSILVAPGTYDQIPFDIYGPDDITVLGSGFTGTEPSIIEGDGSVQPGGKFALHNLSGWEIAGFEMRYGNKGVTCANCGNIYLHDLYIHDSNWYYADGIGLEQNENITIEKCLISHQPFAGVNSWYGGNSDVTIQNCTMAYNHQPGIIALGTSTNMVIKNNIVVWGDDDGIEFAGTWTGTETLDYNDSYGNDNSNWYGCSMGPHSISLDPQLVGGMGWETYLLLPSSPCIDAGDPTLPPDPDGTVSDIGCFYFDQNQPQGNLSVDLDPLDPPVIIPPEGGYIDYDLLIECDSSNYAFFDGWIEFVLPDGQIMTPVILRPSLFLPANGEIFREMEMWISQWAMPGIYEFWCKVGDYPETVLASDMFEFEKLPADEFIEGAEAQATISGWGEPETVKLPTGSAKLPRSIKLTAAPNPFNPETTLNFTLPAPQQTSVKIYDLQGRNVMTLLNRQLDAGYHSLKFDAGQLSSGVYLAMIESGQYRAVEKLMLIK